MVSTKEEDSHVADEGQPKEIRLKDIQLNQVRNTMCSPERITEFGSMKRDELKAAVEVNVRAYENYVYFTNYFPDREERIKAIRDMNLAFYRKRGFEVFHSEEIANDGKVMGSWSMRKIL